MSLLYCCCHPWNKSHGCVLSRIFERSKKYWFLLLPMKDKQLQQFPSHSKQLENEQITSNICFQTLDIGSSRKQSLRKRRWVRLAQRLHHLTAWRVFQATAQSGNPKEPSVLSELRKQRWLEFVRLHLRKEKNVQRASYPWNFRWLLLICERGRETHLMPG